MSHEHLRRRMDELDLAIEHETDTSRILRLICERLDVLNTLLSLQADEQKAESI